MLVKIQTGDGEGVWINALQVRRLLEREQDDGSPATEIMFDSILDVSGELQGEQVVSGQFMFASVGVPLAADVVAATINSALIELFQGRQHERSVGR